MNDRPGSLVDWFARNPRIGLIGTFASVVGVPLAIVLFLASQKDRDIRYAVSASPTTIVKAGQSSDLRVHFKGQELTSDVSSIQIAIWNAGKESVRQENILSKTVSLKLVPPTSVLTARVKKMTRELVGFRVDVSNSSSGILTVSWNILELGDGALLEVIYTGTSEQVVVEGAIEGKVPIERVVFGEQAKLTIRQTVIIGGFAILLGIWGAVKRYRTTESTFGVRGATVSALATGVLWTVYAFAVLFVTLGFYLLIKQPSVPFSF